MKRLHVISSVDPRGGGPIEGIKQMAAVHTRLGHEVEVVCGDTPHAPWLADFPLPCHALGPSKGGYCHNPRMVPWLMEHAEEYDAVVVDGIWQYHALAAWRAMRKLDRPYVVFTHGMLDPWFKKRYPLKHLKKCLYWPMLYRVLRDAEAVIFTCDDERRLARQSFRPYRVVEEVVNYGTAGPVGDARAQRASFLSSYPELEGTRFLLFLSRIHPKKGCDLLIEAFSQTAAADPDLRLAMAGPDQAGWRHELESLARRCCVADRVVWTGMLTGDLKWGAFHACDAFILPSHQENFGVVVAEAMACGKAVLISNKVNIWREIEEDGAGLTENDDLAGTSRLISRWQALGEGERAAMAGRARQCFVSRFEIRKAAESLLPALQKHCVQHSAGTGER